MQSCFQGALDFFLLSFGFKVGKFQVGAEVFFSSVCGVESGLSRVDTGLSMQVLLGTARGAGGKDLFSFQPIRGPKLRGIRKIFFFNFPCFLICSHNVPFKFLMGSHNVPQVHNVFPNMFSIYKHLTFSPYA